MPNKPWLQQATVIDRVIEGCMAEGVHAALPYVPNVPPDFFDSGRSHPKHHLSSWHNPRALWRYRAHHFVELKAIKHLRNALTGLKIN
jgi:hypothetical protein